MLISIIKQQPIGATPTETSGLIITSDFATVRIFEKKSKAVKMVNYSCDVMVSFLNLTINHN